jgi:type IV pilus assembly protein PilA
MKKMLKNQKGFSLVELLIVIAIMGVLAALAFSMFAGILGNSRRRADERTADQIAKALTSYIVESGDAKLEILSLLGGGGAGGAGGGGGAGGAGGASNYSVSLEMPDGSSLPATAPSSISITDSISGDNDDASKDLVSALQYVIVVENTSTKRVVKYGPYLTPKEGKGIDWENYAPTWSGHRDGYFIGVYPSLQKADVLPVPTSNPGNVPGQSQNLVTGVYEIK